MKKKNNYDSPDKIILKKFKDEIARDVFGFKEASEIEIVDSNLQISEELRADTVFLIRNKGSRDTLLHIEVQTSDDENMPKRMHNYRYFLNKNYPGKDILQVVLYLGPEKPKMKNVYEEGKTVEIPMLDIKFVSLTRTEFGIIDIGEKTVDQILQSRIRFFLNFLCLAEREKRKQNPNAFIKECINKAKESFESPKEKEMLKTVYEGIAVHATLAGADKTFIKNLFKKEEVRKMIDLKDLPLYEEAVEQGKIEGKIEGEIEAKIKVARKLFKKGIDIRDIAEVTEMPKEEIEKIIKEEAVDFLVKKKQSQKGNIQL
ncbi:hypothetical protein [Thermoanaerobacter pentosaceus]|uniref:Transposase YdaD n=1 Tax=Thermoanaerobacter pentosaceus TaxID=694059 RepID=A0ABT9M2H0_9THEO|nr:hypothetical protein [Thermoanaerobacter pentosaceus]MDP9750329.1 putative transposase YdaD [Thermoanaerobacter pentosaceus]